MNQFDVSYEKGLQGQRGIFLNGIDVDVTQVPVFQPTLNEGKRIYRLFDDPEHSTTLTYTIPNTNIVTSASYLLPENKDELEMKWDNTHLWMSQTYGLMPRLPDFLQHVLVGMYNYKDKLASVDSMYGRNIDSYFRYCSENNITHTHAIADPQIDRSQTSADDESLALSIVEKRSDGVVVRGAKQLASFSPFSHELMVYLNPGAIHNALEKNIIWFALPIGTPGLKFVCRGSYSPASNNDGSSFSRMDEQDAMVFFDDVLIPYDRIFLIGDKNVALEGYFRANDWSIYSNLIRFLYRYKTFYYVASQCADVIGVSKYPNIAEKLGDLALFVEVIESFLKSIKESSYKTGGGLYAPGDTTAASIFAMENSRKAASLVRDITASGIIMQPTEGDLSCSEISGLLNKYMRGKNTDASSKAKLFRLAWDLVGSSYGMRQIIYDQWFRGPISNHKIGLHNSKFNSDEQRRFLNL